jgi:hypothetical protein
MDQVQAAVAGTAVLHRPKPGSAAGQYGALVLPFLRRPKTVDASGRGEHLLLLQLRFLVTTQFSIC